MSEEPVRIEPGELESFLGSLEDIEVEPNGNTPTIDPSTDFSWAETNPAEDIPIASDPGPFAEDTTPIGDGTCVVCGAPTFRPPGLTKAGRKKRAPRYCDLHTSNAGVSGKGPIFAGLESQLSRIQEELADDMKLLGTMAGPLFPVTGYYIFENADPFTIALLKLCKNNQRALRVLHRAASVAPVYEVLRTTAGVAYSVQVDRHGAEPHNAVAHRLGVSHAYDTVYGSDIPSNGNTIPNNGFSPPPHYAGVQ